MESLLAEAKKIPLPVWVGALIAAGVILLFQRNSSSSKSSTTSASGDTTAQPPAGPGGSTSPCQTYSMPTCTAPDFVIYESDDQGCLKPVCASSLGGSGGNPPPPTGGVTCHTVLPGEWLSELAAIYHTPGGWQQIQAWNITPNACGPGYPSLESNPNIIQPTWKLRVL